MDIVISQASDKPIYVQIYDQLSAQILNGTLASGLCLPPIRTVARELEISVITVKKAWEELERRGLIHTMMGKGCFVAPLANSLDDKKEELLLPRLRADMAYYRSLGLSKEKLIEIISQNYDKKD